nr:hypothetical protein Iba_chr05bCG3660 [Ipomoea batatas]
MKNKYALQDDYIRCIYLQEAIRTSLVCFEIIYWNLDRLASFELSNALQKLLSVKRVWMIKVILMDTF